jgi:ABC-type cobalamin/Fe3+-siderophores transport system ATPase subunit
MIYRERAMGWDFAFLIVGAAAALLSMREQSFGESLRDQLNRSIAQLDEETTSARRTSVLVIVLMGGICPTAILLATWQLNEESISDDGLQLVGLIILLSRLWLAASGYSAARWNWTSCRASAGWRRC